MIDAARIVSYRSGGELWQGSRDAALAAREHGFDVVVLTAEEAQFDGPGEAELLRGLEVVRFPSDDCKLEEAHLEKAKVVAKIVAAHVRARKKVLVTCYMGWNRSGLVVALATRVLTGRPGMLIAARIRQKRRFALSNKSFREYIEAMR